MSDHPSELDALPLADLLDPDSAATNGGVGWIR